MFNEFDHCRAALLELGLKVHKVNSANVCDEKVRAKHLVYYLVAFSNMQTAKSWICYSELIYMRSLRE